MRLPDDSRNIAQLASSCSSGVLCGVDHRQSIEFGAD
jgi:hypothetical protein